MHKCKLTFLTFSFQFSVQLSLFIQIEKVTGIIFKAIHVFILALDSQLVHLKRSAKENVTHKLAIEENSQTS